MEFRTKAKYTDEATPLEKKNKALSYQAACEGIVLLENNGLLPVKAGKIALYGAGAGKTIKGGSGSGEVNERHAVTILEGLASRGFEIVTASWLDRYDALWEQERKVFITSMQKKLRKFNAEVLAELMSAEYRYPYGDAIRDEDLSDETDICIYVLSRQSGEGRDRRKEDYRISDGELAHLQTCAEHYKKIILVVNVGASFDLSFVKDFEAIGSVIYACQLGQEGGNALADMLLGKVSPSGKLAATWAKSYDDIPFAREYSYMSADTSEANYREGIYVGYRYYDSFGVVPRYPFGYGLSYTDFSWIVSEVRAENTVIKARVSVRNTGNMPGKEVIQLYVSCPAGKLEKEYQRLAAFAKTETLQSGKEQALELSFPMEALASYDEEAASYLLEKGGYVLRVGNSSRNTGIAAVLELSETVVLSKHRNLCAAPRPMQTLHREKKEEAVDAQRICIDPAVFVTEVMDYAEAIPAEDAAVAGILGQLTTGQQIHFCAGIGLLGGKTAFTLPGSVGNTTSEFVKLGVSNATFCDGPAGIRLQRRSTVNRRGGVKPVDGAMSVYEYLPGFLKKFLYGDPQKETVIYQHVTSFPVETAIAQTWNLPLAEEIGRTVSGEMTEYGVVFWLAPALNIIRNPLCGRNYEYYSEDPLVSGKMAAATIRGVQRVPGNYATVKHFAANNQEENRYYVSSNIDERTLREIYLRGFEIAVREAKPRALMTAYNKINGTYCPENGDLIDYILRREWGFDGIVMTDWLSTGGDRAGNLACIRSGLDLIMPGGRGVWKELQKAYRSDKLSSKDIRRAACRVLKLVLDSRINV